ncbi:hypothetical protein HOU82_gp16 [Klebsiella phage TSK1]|uniref:Uncharacterized protein n=1 Tax=Klebsiella phage TSK1 TaxID=2301532 RepID=A0A3S5GP57_9CAUD|nr:hypothetical protein HOU82_gp16 [Klebsiella phage TSK1]AXN53777.1 hypothetical protein [Klebsiella phage TSK1]
MQYKIILTARKMGGFCKSCIQEFSMTIEANDTADAVEKAKSNPASIWIRIKSTSTT